MIRRKTQSILSIPALLFFIACNSVPLPLLSDPGRTSLTSGRMWHNTTLYTRVAIPRGFLPPSSHEQNFEGKEFHLKVFAKKFAQGNAVYVEITPNQDYFSSGTFPRDYNLKLQFEGHNVPLTHFYWGYRGIIGLSPDLKPGSKWLKVTAKENKNNGESRSYRLQVTKTDFPVSKSSLNLSNYSNTSKRASPEAIALIQHGRKVKNKVFSLFGPDHLTRNLSHPRDMHYITSPFFVRRIYEQYVIKNGKKIYRKPRHSVHRGLDFRGRPGSPIFAIADGEVVMAEKLYYEGNFTVFDHGKGIFSAYMQWLRKKRKKEG